MVDLSDVEAMRPILIGLCGNEKCRINPPIQGSLARNRWHPYGVIETISRSRYTDIGAWDFIIECLRSGTSINCKPPSGEHNDFAYVMKESDYPGSSRIYMKIVIIPPHPVIHGVSFHVEDPRI